MTEITPDDLLERCSELFAWKRSGIYKGTALAAFADRLVKAGHSDEFDRMRQAEARTVDEVLAIIASLDPDSSHRRERRDLTQQLQQTHDAMFEAGTALPAVLRAIEYLRSGVIRRDIADRLRQPLSPLNSLDADPTFARAWSAIEHLLEYHEGGIVGREGRALARRIVETVRAELTAEGKPSN